MHIEFGREFFRHATLVLFRQFVEIIGMVGQSEIAEIALEKTFDESCEVVTIAEA